MSELPNGWAIAKIGELCSLINGRAFKPQEWSNNGLPIIRIQNLNNRKAPFNQFSGALDERHLIKKEDLLFAWSGTPGTSFGAHIWHGDDAALNQHIFKIDFNTAAVERNFLRYAINQKLDELIGAAQGGVGLRHVTKGTFEETSISFPPHAEQARIAKALDGLLAQVDTLKARLDALPTLIKRFRQSVLSAAVSGQLTDEWRKAQADDLIAMPWRTTELSEISELVTSGSRGWADYYSNSGAIFIRSQDINTDDLDVSDTAFVDLPSSSEGKRTRVRREDLLITITGANVGKVARVKISLDEAYVSQHVALARLKDVKSAPYIELYLKDIQSGRRKLTELAYGGGKPGLNLSNIRDLDLALPSQIEQNEIVRRANELFTFADQLEARLADARQRVDALTQSILAKAFRGELVPQDPNDEPASVLLERVAAQRAADPKPKRGRKAAAH